ncbi:hypothetical protein DNTS_011616 [Danionella cerebrum]|uniref:EGF-like domain-containing protein n=1 Tax=Danionella cerebrum TaxID=2873325 RepID=A0A553QIC1_9TELE|nr:hypothetical protein DNTS_011616 [Danionella translucida]
MKPLCVVSRVVCASPPALQSPVRPAEGTVCVSPDTLDNGDAIECPEGLYGVQCRQVCECEKGAVCDPVNGACHCTAGRVGEHCEKILIIQRVGCPIGFYGLECVQMCQCGHEAQCHHIISYHCCTPSCAQPLCLLGAACLPALTSAFSLCCVTVACASGWFGMDCEQKCDCPLGVACDNVTGRCGCPAGYTGSSCETNVITSLAHARAFLVTMAITVISDVEKARMARTVVLPDVMGEIVLKCVFVVREDSAIQRLGDVTVPLAELDHPANKEQKHKIRFLISKFHHSSVGMERDFPGGVFLAISEHLRDVPLPRFPVFNLSRRL